MSTTRAFSSNGGIMTKKADAAHYRFRILCQGSDADHVKVISATTDRPVGITLDGADAAEDLVSFGLLGRGETKTVKLNGTCDKGDLITPEDPAVDATGKARAVPATAGAYWVIGRALEAGVDEQEIAIEDCVPYLAGAQHANGQCGLPAFASDPTGVPAQMWYNDTSKAIKAWVNGEAVTIANLLLVLAFVISGLCTMSASAADKTPAVISSATTGKVAAATGSDNVKVPGTLEVTGAQTLTGNTTMSGDAAITGTLGVTGAQTLTGNTTMSGDAAITGTLGVTGAQTFTGNTTMSGDATVAGDMTVTGTLSAGGYVSNVSKAFAYDAMTDNTNATGYIDFTTTIPAGALVLGWKAVTTTGFTGDTTATIQVGIAGGVGNFSTVTSGSVVAAGTVGSASVLATSFCAAATTARVTITGGADFTSISAGACTVTIFYAQ